MSIVRNLMLSLSMGIVVAFAVIGVFSTFDHIRSTYGVFENTYIFVPDIRKDMQEKANISNI